MEEFISQSDETTLRIGEDFSKKLSGGEVIFLKGHLGSGKTSFVKGIARGLGIKTRIISPTFILLRQHTVLANKTGIKTLYHLDLYRLDTEDQVKDINLKDFLDDKEGLVVIEWPNVGQNIVKGQYWVVTFSIEKDNSRVITISHENQ